MNTGAKIRFYRLLNGLTQEELSQSVKTDATYLVRYERGPISPPTKIFLRLCEELGIDANWLAESRTAPYVFFLGEPVKEGMVSRQITGLMKALEELFPDFIEDCMIDVFSKIPISYGAAYCFAFHARDSQGKLLPKGSVLIFTLPQEYVKQMDQLLEAHSLVSKELEKQEISLSLSSNYERLDLAKEEVVLKSVLERLEKEGAGWIDPGECIRAWRQRIQIQGKREEWVIPLSLTVKSTVRISKEQALQIVEKMVKDTQKKLPENVTLLEEYRKRGK